MAIRTVLVGLVAGLGLTIPSNHQVDSWKHSVQTWVSARLAEYDGEMPMGENAFVYTGDPIPVPKQPAAPLPATKTEIAEKSAESVLLDTLASGTSLPTIFGDLTSPPRAPITVAAEIASSTAPVVSPEDAAFNAVVEEMIASFSADIALTLVEELAIADLDESQDEWLAELNHTTEGLCRHDEPAPRVPAVQTVVVVETESGDEFDPNVVFGLDEENQSPPVAHASPTCEPAVAPVAPVVTASQPDDSLTRAVRLTREAVFAWANLLSGPAVVTATH